MGQRLVISIMAGGEEIAAVYYHWSAYTSSTLTEIWQLLDYFKRSAIDFGSLTQEQAQLAVIHAVEDNTSCDTLSVNGRNVLGLERGGVDPDDLDAAKKLFPNEHFVEHPSRNAGLVGITPKTIDDLHRYEEGCAEIDLVKRTFQTGVFWEDSADCPTDDMIAPGDLAAAKQSSGPDLRAVYSWDEITEVSDAVLQAPSIWHIGNMLIGKIE